MRTPVPPLYSVAMSRAALPALSSPYDLTDAQVGAFVADGHVLVPGLVSPEEVAAYRPTISAATLRLSQEKRSLAERDTYAKAFLQVPNLWQHDRAVAGFVLAARFAGVAADLLGVDRVRVYHDQALFKEPGGGRTPWHQDARYWPLDGDRCLTMWVPLVDLATDMGGLAFASGTHRSGQLADLTISDASDRFFADLLAIGTHPVAGPVPMRAGDATVHHGWTVHRALPNESGTMREVMTVIYLADGLTVREPANEAQRNDLARWLPGLRPGDVAASSLNPVLPTPAGLG